jgi:hypothetical protein
MSYAPNRLPAPIGTALTRGDDGAAPHADYSDYCMLSCCRWRAVSGGASSPASSPRACRVRAAKPLPRRSKRAPRRRQHRRVRSRSVIWRPTSRCPAVMARNTAWQVTEVVRRSCSRGSPKRSQKVERPNAAHSVRVGIKFARSTSRTSPPASILRKRIGPSRSHSASIIHSSAIHRGQSRAPMAWSTRISSSRPGGRSISAPTAGSPTSTNM